MASSSTSMPANLANRSESLQSRLDDKCKSSIKRVLDNSSKPITRALDSQSDTKGVITSTSLSLETVPCQRNSEANLKRSKSEDCQRKSEITSDSDDNDDDSDEGVRCRTPLLGRSGGITDKQEPPKSVPSLSKIKSNSTSESERHNKKVTFKTRSLDGGSGNRILETSLCPKLKGGETKNNAMQDLRNENDRDQQLGTIQSDSEPTKQEVEENAPVNANATKDKSRNNDKICSLIPTQESLLGWNQSGGPFTSQWLFQAVSNSDSVGTASSASPLCHPHSSFSGNGETKSKSICALRKISLSN